MRTNQDIGEDVLLEKDTARKVATFTFNLPEKLNCLRRVHLEWMIDRIGELEEDNDVKVIVLKGNGRCFGSGHDVRELGHLTGFGTKANEKPSQRDRFVVDRNMAWGRKGIMQSVLWCLKPTIAQVHGYCYGGHFEIAMNCDIVIASEEATFGHPGFRFIGPTTDIGYWIELLGVRRTKEMVLTGRPVTAVEAERWGMITKCVAREDLQNEVNTYVDAVLAMPMDGLVIGKAHLEAALDALGVGTAETIAAMMHSWQLNLKFAPDEFNLLKTRRDQGLRQALINRDARFPRGFKYGPEAEEYAIEVAAKERVGRSDGKRA